MPCLRAALVAAPVEGTIPDSEDLRRFESALEVYLPGQLGWRHGSFDGFRFCVAERLDSDAAVFLGLALLITDQSWTLGAHPHLA